jgi:hypothetical protein
MLQQSFFLLQLLDELFEIPELASSWSLYAPTILSEILVPCGVWSVGKVNFLLFLLKYLTVAFFRKTYISKFRLLLQVGAAIRHAAIVGIWTFLRRGLCTQV